ncbi:MAG: MarR family winged helix-turn-helix transcriptional regulator [Gammaproteobacteria bacterium]|nr:MarR family winged helix-turn-helix transcriptional regulator [Gammaproteobacteria bacterium]
MSTDYGNQQQAEGVADGFGAGESPSSYLRLDTFLPSVIRNLAEEITASMSRRYTGDFQLTITEWRIILQLAAKESLTATEIVEITAMEKSKVSRAVSNLEERGLVARTPAEEDHRTKTLTLSPSGQKLYGSIVPRVLDWEKYLLEGLEISEYRDLLYLLNKLRSRLKDMS